MKPRHLIVIDRRDGRALYASRAKETLHQAIELAAVALKSLDDHSGEVVIKSWLCPDESRDSCPCKEVLQ